MDPSYERGSAQSASSNGGKENLAYMRGHLSVSAQKFLSSKEKHGRQSAGKSLYFIEDDPSETESRYKRIVDEIEGAR